ncbi:MAG: diaminopimelate epimerase [Rikenellaceae bacterium]
MKMIEYILCHGSGNRFVLLDAVKHDLTAIQTAEFVQKTCQCNAADGVLFLTQDPSGLYAMRMFNTDGSEAEMCGNGIRCVARLVSQRYISESSYTMISGSNRYPITHEQPIAEGVETYSVEIGIATHSADFTLTESRFVGKSIEALDPSLYFTYLNLGNPHIVAMCDNIDLDHLTTLGERVKRLTMIFPKGVNVSLIKYLGEQQIFVATYERGVGLTPSCGTAMTASCTAATLLGVCREQRVVEVRNRGGMVYCTTKLQPSLTTKLTGNATFDSIGHLAEDGQIIDLTPIDSEREAWAKFTDSLK